MTTKLRTALLTGLTVATVGILAAPIAAQPMQSDRSNRLFSMLDANGDGIVTKEEYKTFRDQMFVRHDTNGDGTLTQDDMQGGARMGGGRGPQSGGPGGQGMMGPGGQGRMGNMPMRGMMEADGNQDGKIARDEWDARTEELFTLRDRNKDAQLTPDEMGPLGRMGPRR